MKGSGLRIRASVRMRPASALPASKALTAGWGPTVSYRGTLFPGRVLVCEKPIGPGQIGEAVIDILFLTSSPRDVAMRVGSIFQLLDGPNPIASATMINLIETPDQLT